MKKPRIIRQAKPRKRLNVAMMGKALVVIATLGGFIALASYSQTYAKAKNAPMASNAEMAAFVEWQVKNYRRPKCGKDDWLCEMTYYKPYKGKANAK